MDYIELGRRIRSVRRERQLTQAALAEKTGVSTSFIGHIERGSRIVSLDTFVHICTALNTSPNALLAVPFSQELTPEQNKLLEKLLHYACQMVRN